MKFKLIASAILFVVLVTTYVVTGSSSSETEYVSEYSE